MHDFEVWAPRARTMEVRVGGNAYAMTPSARGRWSARVDQAGPGVEYAFLVNGEGPFPDPRSPFQPHGVHGPSQLVSHSAFNWTDGNWQPGPLAKAIIYELHVGTFTPAGTFASAIERLEHLRELGVTHVELMPVNEFSGQWGWGYDGVDLFAPHHAYGTPDDLKRLVDACHAKGLAVLLDVVYNHFGPAGNYLERFGPYFTAAYKTPWGEAVNLDQAGSDEVRRFFFDNAAMWLRDYHFDGLRLDAIHAYYDRSALPFLEELAIEVDALSSDLGRPLVLIAESDLNDARIVTSRAAGGFGIDAQWSDDFHHALHSVLTRETNGYYEDFGSLEQLAVALRRAFVYAGHYSQNRGRRHGREVPVQDVSGHSFLGYAQNHDQTGNRAHGERLSHLVSPGRQKVAAALMLTAPFVPMLFQGEEFAACSPFLYFTNHEDSELGRAVSEGRRNEFGAFGWSPEEVPDPQDSANFQRSKLDWNELADPPHNALLVWYKRLIALRQATPSLTSGRLDQVEVAFDEKAGWLKLTRAPVEVLCNLSDQRQTVPASHTSSEPICSENAWRLLDDGIELPPDSVAIFGAD